MEDLAVAPEDSVERAHAPAVVEAPPACPVAAAVLVVAAAVDVAVEAVVVVAEAEGGNES